MSAEFLTAAGYDKVYRISAAAYPVVKSLGIILSVSTAMKSGRQHTRPRPQHHNPHHLKEKNRTDVKVIIISLAVARKSPQHRMQRIPRAGISASPALWKAKRRAETKNQTTTQPREPAQNSRAQPAENRRRSHLSTRNKNAPQKTKIQLRRNPKRPSMPPKNTPFCQTPLNHNSQSPFNPPLISTAAITRRAKRISLALTALYG